MKKKRRRPAQFRLVKGKLYRLTPARGKGARAEATRRRKAAKARRARRKVAAPPAVAAAEAAAGGEVVLYEAPEVEGGDAFEDWAQLPVNPSTWVVQIQFLRNGVVQDDRTLELAPEWDGEPAPAQVRRAIRAAHDAFVAEHGGETPQATIIRLLLRSGAV